MITPKREDKKEKVNNFVRFLSGIPIRHTGNHLIHPTLLRLQQTSIPLEKSPSKTFHTEFQIEYFSDISQGMPKRGMLSQGSSDRGCPDNRYQNNKINEEAKSFLGAAKQTTALSTTASSNRFKQPLQAKNSATKKICK